jgi:outer membrane protein TolC
MKSLDLSLLTLLLLPIAVPGAQAAEAIISDQQPAAEGQSLDLEVKEPLQCSTVKIISKISSPLPPFTFCSPVSADPGRATPTVQPLQAFSFDKTKELVDQAISKDNLINSQQQMVESAVYGLKSAKGNWWPTISMSNSSLLFTNIDAGQNYSGSPVTPASPATAGKAFNPFNGSTPRDQLAGFSTSPQITPFQRTSSTYTQAYPVITVQWNFLNPGRYPQIAAARKQLELAKSQVAQTILSRKDSFAQNIALYLLSGVKLGELQSMLILQNQIFKDSSRRVKTGLDPRYTRLQQFRNILNVQSQILQVKTAQSNAAIQLQQSLANAMPAQANGQAAPPITVNELISSLPLDQFPVQDWPYSVEETVSRSLKASSNLQQLQLQAGIAIDNANQQSAADLPTIGILGYSTYQYTWGSQGYQPPTQPAGALSTSLSNYIGLSVSWNLFNGHIYRNQAISYRRQASSIQSQYADARNQLIVNIRSLHRQLGLLKQQIALGLADYQAAGAISSDMKIRTKYKVNTTADNLQSMADMHQSRLQLISSIAQYLDTYAKLSVAIGVPALAAR